MGVNFSSLSETGAEGGEWFILVKGLFLLNVPVALNVENHQGFVTPTLLPAHNSVEILDTLPRQFPLVHEPKIFSGV